MLNLNVFYVNKKPSINWIKHKKNSLLSNFVIIENNLIECSFQSHYNFGSVPVKIWLHDLLDENDLNDTFNEIIQSSYNYAKELSEENMGELTNNIKKLILSTFQLCFLKCQYNSYLDIFYLAANLFFNINVTHKLSNGNKRLAISVLIKFLYYTGYYFKFQNDEYTERRDWEKKCIEYISRNEKKENPETIINDIKQWILDNIVIALNFR